MTFGYHLLFEILYIYFVYIYTRHYHVIENVGITAKIQGIPSGLQEAMKSDPSNVCISVYVSVLSL